jgi:hypothetical protein
MKYVILGFGKFGRLAYKRLHTAYSGELFVIADTRPEVLTPGDDQGVITVHGDATEFLSEAQDIRDEDIIVPMVPFHLAAAYAVAVLDSLASAPLSESVEQKLPNPFRIDAFTVACSMADFLCPDDCPEGDVCTVTGQPRDVPLYERLESLQIEGRPIVVLRSFQLLPGVGGYRLADLKHAVANVSHGAAALATSCKCHGIITGMHADS